MFRLLLALSGITLIVVPFIYNHYHGNLAITEMLFKYYKLNIIAVCLITIAFILGE